MSTGASLPPCRSGARSVPQGLGGGATDADDRSLGGETCSLVTRTSPRASGSLLRWTLLVSPRRDRPGDFGAAVVSGLGWAGRVVCVAGVKDVGGVGLGPTGERPDLAGGLLAQLGERVVDTGRDYGVRLAVHEAIALEGLEGLGEHLLAHPASATS
jgi:hypothetical protein